MCWLTSTIIWRRSCHAIVGCPELDQFILRSIHPRVPHFISTILIDLAWRDVCLLHRLEFICHAAHVRVDFDVIKCSKRMKWDSYFWCDMGKLHSAVPTMINFHRSESSRP